MLRGNDCGFTSARRRAMLHGERKGEGGGGGREAI